MISRRSLLVSLLATAVMVSWHDAAAEDSPTPLTLHVAPDGDDSAAGTKDHPLRTLQGARDAVRAIRKTATIERPITVLLADGVYLQDQPLKLAPQDSGTADSPVVYRAAPSARPLVSGGRRITGWKKTGDNVWTATISQATNRQWDFRQIYVDGKLRRRARTPNEGFLRVAGFPDGGRDVHYHTDCQRFQYAPGDLDPHWTNLQDVEVIVYHFWTDSHLPIREIDAESRIVTFQHKAGKVFTDDFTSDGARYIVENVREALDAPGEWYLDRQTGKLSYIPMRGEDMNDVEVIAPVAPALIDCAGKPLARDWVENIAFEGIHFSHTNFVLPKGNSNDRQGSAGVPAAIVLKGARRIRFEQCEVTNLGTFAFEIGPGCSDNRFVANEIGHVAGGGFRIDGGTQADHPLLRTHDNTITDNHLHHYGDFYPSAVGVLLMNTSGNTVAHNDIHHGWYTGISLGWVWGYQRSISRDNLVSHNHIHHIGQGLLSDMGAIYTLGVSPGTLIRNNLIHDIDANHYGGWGIYNDEGSSHILIENNIVYDTKFAGYNIHYAKEVTVRNNIFALGRLEQITRGRVEPHKSVFFENNIVYWTDGPLFNKNWGDKPYLFHFHPKNDSGRREETSTFEADWNLYFNPKIPLSEVDFAGDTYTEWLRRGKDRHSLYADPCFVDVEGRDFTLQAESPAWDLGFEPIDMSNVGPRR